MVRLGGVFIDGLRRTRLCLTEDEFWMEPTATYAAGDVSDFRGRTVVTDYWTVIEPFLFAKLVRASEAGLTE